MKNKTEVSSTGVCVRMSKAGLEGGGLSVVEKRPPPPHSSPPHSPPLSPPTSASTPPSQTKIKCESPTTPFLSSHTPSPRPVVSPPAGGPGAEVKGKPGTPIPSGSTKVPQSTPRPSSAGSEEAKPSSVMVNNAAGGRLTFFKEGKFLLELSHRTDMGAPAGWVPVKSKTYWPPPSSTTTTTTQHPLRHDTPTSQSVSDDCSSLNSSPWTNEHVRKQPVPGRNKSFVLQQVSFYWCSTPQLSVIRKKVHRRRNPFVSIGEPAISEKSSDNSKVSYRKIKSEYVRKTTEQRKQRLEKWILLFGLKCGIKLETETTVKTLYEKPAASAEVVDPTFVSPRKRYLRQMESDQECMHRKKLHSGANSVPHISGERPSSSSTSTLPLPQSNRSAINSQTSSVYSIESILNHGNANRKNDSFLRTLLKPEPKPSSTQSRSSVVKERANDVPITSVKVERHERSDRLTADRLEQLSAGQSDKADSLIDLNRLPADRYDFSRPGPMTSLYSLSPYLDPRYMMLQSLAPSLVPSQHSEVAQAFAAATAAAAAAAAGLSTYPLAHLHPSLAGAQYPHLLHSGYTPPTSIASQLLRPQPHSSRSSPHPIPHSPSPKPQVPSTPASPHLSRGASPRGAPSPWQPPPSIHSLSPHRPLSSPLPSPPPQDAPLNLSKPRNHIGK